MLTIITTCKNRLHHLQRSLPLMCEQSHSEIIVVDYGCEQGTAEWVNNSAPNVKVIRVSDVPIFSSSKARNIGARNASTKFLCFLDADMLLNTDIGHWTKNHAEEDKFYTIDLNKNLQKAGFLICSRSDFEKIGGYDEAFVGWGHEDGDIYERLENLGIEKIYFSGDTLTAIQHGDELRLLKKNNPMGDITKNQALVLGEVYRLIKIDIQFLIRRDLDLNFRNYLFKLVHDTHKQALTENSDFFYLTINLAPEKKRNLFCQGERELKYKFPVARS